MPPTRLCGLCLLVLCAAAVPSAADAEVREQEMLDELNQVRARHDLRPLEPSASLEGSASAYAGTLMRGGWFGHSPAILGRPGFRTLGEALALHRGHRLLRARTVRAWLRSPVHRGLVLSQRFRLAGAGHARGRFRGRRATIWVLRLGS
jgi:uncharacterized protein YkwD